MLVLATPLSVHDVAGASGSLRAEAAEQRAAGIVLGLPFRGADPAVAIAGAAVLEMEGVQHAVADEPVRAGRLELRVGAVAIERAVELARQFARDFQERRVAFHRDRRQIGPGRLGRHLVEHRTLPPIISLHRKDMGKDVCQRPSSKIFTVSKLRHIRMSHGKNNREKPERTVPRAKRRPARPRPQRPARPAPPAGRRNALSSWRPARRVAAGGRAGAGARRACRADAARGGARGRRVACRADPSFRRSHRAV